VSLPTWAAIGCGAALAGNMLLLLATALIVSETNACFPALLPLVLATTVAKAVADALAQGVRAYAGG
jgi:H+/Cl- antiporter ClcA